MTRCEAKQMMEEVLNGYLACWCRACRKTHHDCMCPFKVFAVSRRECVLPAMHTAELYHAVNAMVHLSVYRRLRK